ncbi:hypothetical protein [Streptomyces sp. V2I9]|uniref:hypothetical protein n=1 Tax=Streptomyces sp. V2I9 TaxID=3042304 RepID=UPI002788F443|nr:hypothetical protein [Streptomyces sp. V2I9]MDQ0986192.1 hypothetical protein [Streptomyces sp. V2I9]
MTQSGQGEQGGEQQLPAARPAHEGVVLPADGGAPWVPGASGQGEQAAPAGGQPWGQQWGPQSAAPQAQPGQPPPGGYGYPQVQPGRQPQGGYGYPQPGQQPPGGYGYPQAQPLPPAQQSGGQEAYGRPGASEGYPQPGAYQQAQQPGAYQQPQQHAPQPPSPYDPQYPQQQHRHQQHDPAPSQPLPHAQPLPPEAGTGAQGGPGSYGGQGVRGGQGAPGGDADATQYIAPVPGGTGPVAPRPGGGDADATQYIPPVPGGAPYGIRPGAPEDRQPPAEFDNLFRSEEPAGATQQLPQFDAGRPAPPPYQQQGSRPQPPGGYDSGLQGFQGRAEQDGADQHDGAPPRRRSAHIPLIAAVVVGCAVIGLGAGALMSGGDGSGDDKQPVASQSSQATAPTTEAAPPDPAKPQAEALDKLLADSNNSRAAVISAVEKIKSCKDLDRANTDLRGAAQQRRDLVTRLGGLSVDKLPQQAELVAALNRAWKASAAADEHYATWARQAQKNKSVCKGGQARSTNETAKANQQSGVATRAKREASRLWNTIAGKYGLTQHAYTEL